MWLFNQQYFLKHECMCLLGVNLYGSVVPHEYKGKT